MSHEVVGEEAHGAARERGQAGQRGLAVALHLGGGQGVGVPPVPFRPRDDLARAEADEGVAPDALALLGRLQQERGSVLAQLEEGGDRRLAVVDEGVAQRDQVVLARQLLHVLQLRRDGRQVSRDGH
jgi:hypothetical protein